MLFRRIAVAAAALLATVHIGQAQCVGSNLITALPPDVRATLEAEAATQPFAKGNFWRATKGDEVVHLIGTYHANDPRHAATLATISPLISAASTVLVEAGPDEERALMDRIGRDPGVMMIMTGPTLPEILTPEDWTALSAAMSERGIPGFMAAKFRPWYVSMMLSIPACGMSNLAERGLDGLVMDAAKSANVPVKALEPYDTVFGIFGDMTMEDQIAMIRSTLATEAQSEDFSVTLADTYFAGESRLIWEFMRYQALQQGDLTPEDVAAEFDRMEEAMMRKRNRTWIPVIDAAAAQGPVFAAFGALHLAGPDGVLNLLQEAGFSIEPVALP
jgi:uncharacterized protein